MTSTSFTNELNLLILGCFYHGPVSPGIHYHFRKVSSYGLTILLDKCMYLEYVYGLLAVTFGCLQPKESFLLTGSGNKYCILVLPERKL